MTAWLDTKALSAQIEALRAETRQGFAELRPGLHTEISQLTRRVERLEEQRGLVRPYTPRLLLQRRPRYPQGIRQRFARQSRDDRFNQPAQSSRYGAGQIGRAHV